MDFTFFYLLGLLRQDLVVHLVLNKARLLSPPGTGITMCLILDFRLYCLFLVTFHLLLCVWGMMQHACGGQISFQESTTWSGTLTWQSPGGTHCPAFCAFPFCILLCR